MFTFEFRYTSSLAACIIIAVQNTFTESFASRIQTSLQVIIIRVILKYDLIRLLIIRTHIAEANWVFASFAAINTINMTWTS